jgi:hypothetical protein
MPAKYSVVVPCRPSVPQPQPSLLVIPHDIILIIAWSALVILYGEPG